MFGVMDLETGICISSEDKQGCHLFSYLEKSLLSPTVAVPKEYINHWASGRKCQHKGCFKDGSVKCHVPDYPDRGPDSPRYNYTNINVLEHLCPDHAYEAGYCTLCGDFWGGIQSFDFNNPSHLCDNCHERIDDEEGIDDVDERYYYGENYNNPYEEGQLRYFKPDPNEV